MLLLQQVVVGIQLLWIGNLTVVSMELAISCGKFKYIISISFNFSFHQHVLVDEMIWIIIIQKYLEVKEEMVQLRLQVLQCLGQS